MGRLKSSATNLVRRVVRLKSCLNKKQVVFFLGIATIVAVFFIPFNKDSKEIESSRTQKSQENKVLNQTSENGLFNSVKKLINPKPDNNTSASDTNNDAFEHSTKANKEEGEQARSIGGNSSDNSTPSPSPSSTQHSPTPTPTPSVTPIPTVTTSPTPTPTSILTPTPEITDTFSFNLSPVSPFTPNGNGHVDVEVTKNTNGYWDFLVNGNFSNLLGNRTYQLWFCGINCSSHRDAKFISDSSGNGDFSNVSMSHNQGGDPLNRAVVWEIPPAGEVPSDPKACFMLSNNSTPCLKNNLLF